MKKFLSLVLAMIMTMSLVTISAGATEYKDLTDKDEIQYEEAVAVLNRIGVITGYEDGSFRPDTELTRGAAAKIIVSLMIGPDAASALPNTSSPYPDVPASHTFAGVISYCKTLGYISGYGDGTFKPADPLTGYAFSKMLLGALGYSSDIERFTGTGWTMNVARIGNVAGLFDRISFDGAAAVTRDQACQLALNTLKATMVTYGGTSIINGSTGSYTIQGTDAKPITSNNRDINANIGRKDWYGGNNQSSDYLTLEFGEEHFKDLRLEHDRFDPAHDDFGRPSNEWSYKKVTIGTFALDADYTYTTQVAHVEDSDGTKEKALGLRNYDLVADGGYSFWNGGTWWNSSITPPSISNSGITNLWLNGLEQPDFFAEKTTDGKYVNKVANIADFTDNGTLVEVYVSSVDADWITDVVVIQTQLMEVKKIASDYVTLDQKDPDVLKKSYLTGEANVGFNFPAIDVKVEQVKDTNEDCYAVLNGLKEGDEVAVIPVTTDGGKTYEAAKVYVPETVSGTLTRVDTYGVAGGDKDRGAIEITVGGTSYKIADWNAKMWGLTIEKIKATRKDVTLLLDEYGNAMLAKDVGSTNDFMVIGNFYQALSGNKICTYVHGWDISGAELDLNLGSSVKVDSHGNEKSIYGHVIGELVRYTSENVTGDADYKLTHTDVYDVYTNLKNTDGSQDKVNDKVATFEIKASNLLVPLADKRTEALGGGTIDGSYRVYDAKTSVLADPYTGVDYHNYYFDKSVKFIYVTMEPDGDEVDSIEFKSGAQNVTQAELREDIMLWAAQGCVKDDQVKAIVIKRESNDASLDNMLYVTNYLGMKEYDKETGEKGFEIEALMYKDGKWVEGQQIIVDKDLRIGAFATYSPRESSKYVENFYHVKNFTRNNANPSALYASEVQRVNVAATVNSNTRYSKAVLRLAGDVYTIGTTGAATSNKLTGILSGAANFSAPKTNESYVMGDYRGVSTTIDTFTNPDGVIVTKNAYFLNMVSDKRTYVDDKGITRAWRDLDINDTEALIDNVLAKGYNASVTVLLNEKADSDGFRTAYLVVINDITEGTGSSSGTTNKGAVTYKETVSAADRALFGDIVDDEVVTKPNGNTTVTFTIEKPDWAYMTGTADIASIDYEIYVDGKYWDDGDVTLTVTGTAPYDAAKGTYTASQSINGIALSKADAKDHSVSIKVTDVTWKHAAVEYFTKVDGKTTKLTMDTSASDTREYLDVAGVSGATPATIIFKPMTSSVEQNISYSISGARGGALTNLNTGATAFNAANTRNSDTYLAVGGTTVKVVFEPAAAAKSLAAVTAYGNAIAPAAAKTKTFNILLDNVASADECVARVVAQYVDAGTNQVEVGKSIDFTIHLDGLSNVLLDNYKVTYTLKNGEDEQDVTADVVKGKVELRVTAKGAVDLTVKSVSAEKIEVTTADSAEVTSISGSPAVSVVEIKYTKELTGTREVTKPWSAYVTVDGANGSKQTVTSVEVKKGVLVITLTSSDTDAVANGTQIHVDNIGVDVNGENVLSCTVTVGTPNAGKAPATVANGK